MHRTALMALLLSSLGTICCAKVTAPAEEASVPVLVDGRIAGAALVRGGVAYLPLRSVAKYLGLTATYNPDAQIIIIKTPRAANPAGTKETRRLPPSLP